MINSELNNNGLSNSGTGVPTCHKQPPVAVKKVALRDVHNDNRSIVHNDKKKFPLVEGRPVADTINVSGAKRLTPEFPSSPPFHQSLSNNVANKHLIYSRKKFESELGKGSIQDNAEKFPDYPQSRYFCQMQQEIPQKQTQMKETIMHYLPVVTSDHTASMMTLPCGGPLVPNSLGKKPANGLPGAESSNLKVTSEVLHLVDFKGSDDMQWRERFISLQKFLKRCDESNLRDYIQMLLHVPPAELSQHAVELEKRAIQLTIDEGKEMLRVKALNILGKSSPPNDPLQTTQKLQSKK